MNVLLIGSGGREHALAWKLRQSPTVKRLFCAPGNGGIEDVAQLVSLRPTDRYELLRFAKENKIDLTIVGSEQPLVDGIVDYFEEQGFTIFGPSKAAAKLEGSKVFAKEFMVRNNIPTAKFRCFTKNTLFDAERFIHELSPPIVIKADGLAAGKGVVICETKELAFETTRDMATLKSLGSAGEHVVIEEFLEGEEASMFAISDGNDYLFLHSAQDHKRILDGDKGKNTGGMGAYAPAPIITDDLLKEIERDIILPTLEGMRKLGSPYKGCLYVGLMITETGAKVLEYNCRFGDPETQVVIPLIDGDLAQLLLSAAQGTVKKEFGKLHKASAVCVVIASGGYPDEYQTGKIVRGLDSIKQEDGIVVFHAGTRKDGNDFLTSGGRVLGVTAIGFENDLKGTISDAYRAVDRIAFDGAYYRSDIGEKGIRNS